MIPEIPELGEYVKFENNNKFFTGIVVDIRYSKLFVSVNSLDDTYKISYFEVRKIYTKEEYPEYYI